MGMAISIPRYTIDDLDRMPDDGNRYELLDGMLLVTPPASFGHQLVATSLAARLIAATGPSIAKVVGPGAVRRGNNTHLEPDVLVLPARFSGEEKWDEIDEHWLAVEVLSQSSRIYDREFKRDAYLALGVREVWLVDTEGRTIEVFRESGRGELVSDVVRWRVPGLDRIVSVDLAELFGTAS